MDLWSKLFPNRLKAEHKKSHDQIPSSTSPSRGPAERPFPFTLEKNGVRVLLYRECDHRGRKLLYDSQTVVRTPLSDTPHPTGPQCSSRLFRTPLSLARSGGVSHGPSKTPLRSGTSSLPQFQMSLSEKGGRGGTGGAPRQQSWHAERRKSSVGEVYVEVRNGYGYQYLKEAADTKQIGELVFGSVALAFKGASAKLHLMKEPSRVLMSRTCKAPRSYRSSQASCDTGIEDSFSSFSTSLSEFQLSKVESLESSSSKPLLKPSLPWEMHSAGFAGMKTSMSEEDSGFSGPPSPFSSTCGSYLNPASMPGTPMGTPSSRSGSGSSLKSSGSLSSLQRRFLRNVATSLESFGFASIDEGTRDENRLCSYQTKLGVAVLIETKQETSHIQKQAEEWWFDHHDVLDTLTNKLQSSLETAYLHRGKFVSSVHQAVSQFQAELEDMVYAPRLNEPLWLSLLGVESNKARERLHSRLIDSLAFLLNSYDTKQTNFFISKLLTGVLTHHLGWVSTVGPQISKLPRKSSLTHREKSPDLADVLASYLTKTQPYNALWGQLCELRGSIGYPARVTRTVVVGSDKILLNHILTLLSYLIRCSHVVKNTFEDLGSEGVGTPSGEDMKTNRKSSMVTGTTTRDSGVQKNLSGSETLVESLHRRRQSYPKDCPRRSDELESYSKEPLGKSYYKEPRSSRRTDEVESYSKEPLGKDKRIDESRESPIREGGNQKQTLLWPGLSTNTLAPKNTNASTHSLSAISTQTLQPSPPRGLSSSKTMSDLGAALETSMESFFHSTGPESSPEKMDSPPSSHSSMYPSLRGMQDHRETFGPSGIQPDVITEKVNKLCRVPEGVTGGLWPHIKPEIRVSGEKIDFEIEKGGRVIFMLGEGERLEGLKSKPKPSPSVGSNLDLLHMAVKSLEDAKALLCMRRTSIPVSPAKIENLPPLLTKQRLEHLRTQGKAPSTTPEVNLSVPKQEKPPTTTTVYPSLMELKKTLAAEPRTTSSFTKALLPVSNTSHRRNFSDPTNGAFLLQMPPYTPLPGVVEELKEAEEKARHLLRVDGSSHELEGKARRTPSPVREYRTNDSNRMKREATPVEDWGRIDQHSKLIETLRTKLKPEQMVNLHVAESFMGGILDHYSPVFVLHGSTSTDKLEDQLRADLMSAAHHHVLNSETSEAVAIVAETGRWEIELVSSHSYSTERKVVGGSTNPINYGGIPVMISPLVSQITDSLLNLIEIGTPPHFVIQCLEHHLRGVYLKSQLLSEYLIEGTQTSLNQAGSFAYLGGQSLYNLSELTRTLGIDVNDLPLLLSVASTHTPSLTQMFGLTFK